MDAFEKFIIDNADADTSRLLLSCKEWPADKNLVVNTIEARKRLRKKVPEWWSRTSLRYPASLCSEQCSSSDTARYKAAFVKRILSLAPSEGKVADLTGGLGVDSWAFAEVASKVLYNEMNTDLAEAARHNFLSLGTTNIIVSDKEISPESLASVIGDFHPDVIFLDPGRRSSAGKKVFLLEDCQPDILKLVPSIFRICGNALFKLSPMADISMVVERLDRAYESVIEKTDGSGWNGNWVREVHLVSSGGECKELLVWMDRDWKEGYTIICSENGRTLSFGAEEEKSSKPSFPDSTFMNILFEPGKSLTKAGVFNALCSRFGLVKLGRFTHLYTYGETLPEDELDSRAREISDFGRVFRVKEVLPLNKANIKDVARRYPHCEISARNIPLSSDELRSKLGVSSGDDAYIFGARIEMPFTSGNYLIVAEKPVFSA